MDRVRFPAGALNDHIIIAGSVGILAFALLFFAFGIPYLANEAAPSVSDAINQKIAAAAVSTGIGIPDISNVKDEQIRLEMEETLIAVEEENYSLAYQNAKEIEQILIQKNMTLEHEMYQQIEELAEQEKYGEARELAEHLVQKLS